MTLGVCLYLSYNIFKNDGESILKHCPPFTSYYFTLTDSSVSHGFLDVSTFEASFLRSSELQGSFFLELIVFDTFSKCAKMNKRTHAPAGTDTRGGWGGTINPSRENIFNWKCLKRRQPVEYLKQACRSFESLRGFQTSLQEPWKRLKES